MNQNDIQKIVEFCSDLINEKRVGSRFEGNDIEKLWRLGDLIISIYTEPDCSILLPQLQQTHNQKKLRYDDRFYRASIIFRRYWTYERDYLKAIQNINVWTKLRELYPICERILKGGSKYTRQEIDALISNCKNKTYTEVRNLFITFREKDDTLLKELGIDLYEFRDSFIDISKILQDVVEKNDVESEKKLREIYSLEQFRNFRLILSALQKEEVYKNNKWNTQLKKIVKTKINDSEFETAKHLNNIFKTIFNFINNEKARREIRKSIPITFIGNLSTYLRAIESDANKTQFRKNKDILNKFIGSMGSQNS